MLVQAQYAIIAALVATALSTAAYMAAVVRGYRALAARPAARQRIGAVVGGAGQLDDPEEEPAPARRAGSLSAVTLARQASTMAWVALGCLTVSLVLRAIVTGHGPFVTQHEFAVSMAWGFLAVYLFFEWRYRARTLALLVLPITLAMELYALSWATTADPLVPALQNSLLLTTHIIVAIFAYGAFAVSFAAAGLYLVHDWVPEGFARVLPKREVLDRLGYRAVVIGYPLLTAVIVLGAVWAQIAWGSYWSWDPKETASLVTWLIYGGYLHARVARGWVGRGAAWLLVVAFASVILTFVGNAFFGGLHSYGVTR
ncbi:c-type cytochrome biogenesis protein CcsB [Propioniciclava sp.]|uniref:c-type cytochrome biogenesis protein CcsB n=1 Tax=Propioniciclava sp. TaxID=2038686 RepID=UPI00261A8BD9|nr:c-type cytochrome biogenesis protein CcsB [Propioniciclava sp.]